MPEWKPARQVQNAAPTDVVCEANAHGRQTLEVDGRNVFIGHALQPSTPLPTKPALQQFSTFAGATQASKSLPRLQVHDPALVLALGLVELPVHLCCVPVVAPPVQ